MMMHKLRAATRPYHDRIESDLDLMSPRLDRFFYLRYLEDAYGFYEPWEAKALAILGEQGFSSIFSAKAGTIERDLRHFGFSREDVIGLKRCTDLPPMTGLPDLLGSMYVIEGATLGGQIIAKHVRKLLCLERRGCEFVSGYGRKTAIRWKAFGQFLEGSKRAQDEAAIIQAACRTFEKMHAWFCRREKAAA